ncbi:MAG: hypothetical protein ACE5JQ_00665 [Candidatus Methylomirabilales bacterium]
MKTRIYHVFTNGRDAYAETYKEARAVYRTMKEEERCARLYEQIWDLEIDGNEPIDENCLLSYGGFPW